MTTVVCDTCRQTGNSADMLVCSQCFEVHFCSAEHGANHEHPEVGVNFKRLFRSANFAKALELLAMSAVWATKSVEKNQSLTGDFWQASETSFLANISKGKQDSFQLHYRRFCNALASVLKESDFVQRQIQLQPFSDKLIDIFASENLLSLKQTKTAVKNAWTRFTDELLTLPNVPDAARWSFYSSTLVPRANQVGPILGGGR